MPSARHRGASFHSDAPASSLKSPEFSGVTLTITPEWFLSEMTKVDESLDELRVAVQSSDVGALSTYTAGEPVRSSFARIEHLLSYVKDMIDIGSQSSIGHFHKPKTFWNINVWRRPDYTRTLAKALAQLHQESAFGLRDLLIRSVDRIDDAFTTLEHSGGEAPISRLFREDLKRASAEREQSKQDLSISLAQGQKWQTYADGLQGMDTQSRQEVIEALDVAMAEIATLADEAKCKQETADGWEELCADLEGGIAVLELCR